MTCESDHPVAATHLNFSFDDPHFLSPFFTSNAGADYIFNFIIVNRLLFNVSTSPCLRRVPRQRPRARSCWNRKIRSFKVCDVVLLTCDFVPSYPISQRLTDTDSLRPEILQEEDVCVKLATMKNQFDVSD